MENSADLSAAAYNSIGYLEFLLRLVEATAWPALIGVVIYLLRDEIKFAMSNLERFKVAGAELVFKNIQAATEASAHLNPTNHKDEPFKNTATLSLLKVAETNPIEAIYQAHDRFEKTMREFTIFFWDKKSSNETLSPVEKSRMSGKMGSGPDRLLLAEAGWLSFPEIIMIQNLNEIKNEVSHKSYDIGYDVARDFITLSDKLITSLSLKMEEVRSKTSGAPASMTPQA